jgi:hypothetical protein
MTPVMALQIHSPIIWAGPATSGEFSPRSGYGLHEGSRNRQPIALSNLRTGNRPESAVSPTVGFSDQQSMTKTVGWDRKEK